MTDITTCPGDTITTEEDLQALPDRTVLRDRNGRLAEIGTINPYKLPPQKIVWNEGWTYLDNAIEFMAPFTVLHIPGHAPRPLPTREQIAEAKAQALEHFADEWASGEWAGDFLNNRVSDDVEAVQTMTAALHRYAAKHRKEIQ